MALAHYFVVASTSHWCKKNISYLATLHQSHTNAHHFIKVVSLTNEHDWSGAHCITIIPDSQ